jgi:hypothetical protein
MAQGHSELCGPEVMGGSMAASRTSGCVAVPSAFPIAQRKRARLFKPDPRREVAARAVAGSPSWHQNLNWTPPLKMKPSIMRDTVNGVAVSAAVVVVVVVVGGPLVVVLLSAVVWLPEAVTVVRTVPRL